MSRGKDICKKLKAVRKQIAEENGIELEIPECTYHGPCQGTCPRCESEVQYLESELEKRLRLGKVATVAGLALSLASCSTGTTTETEAIDDDLLLGEIPERVEDDSVPAPPPCQEGLGAELEGIVSQDDGYRVVPTKDTVAHLTNAAFDWNQLYSPKKSELENAASCNPLDEPRTIVRGESGMVILTGSVQRRRILKVHEPQSQLEIYKDNEEMGDRRAMPKTVEYEEVDGVKVVVEN